MRTIRTVGFGMMAAFALGVPGGALEAGPSATVEWSQYGGGPTHDNHRPGRDAIRRPKVLWRLAGARGQPTIANGHLFAGGENLLRIDPTTGRIVAAHAPAAAGSVRVADAPALTSSSVIARATDGRVFAMDHDLKAVKWTWSGPAFFDTRWAGVLVDERAYVLAAGNEVVALSPADGQVLWRAPLREGEEVSMTPAALGDRVFLGTEHGRFLALDVATGQPAWTHEGQSKYSVTVPVVVSGKVIVGDRGIRGVRSGAVLAFDASSGKPLWSTEFGATGFSAPGVVVDPSGGTQIVAGFGRSVALFDVQTGARAAAPDIRTGANAFGSPTAVGDTIYFGNLDGRLYAHDAATGALRWAFVLPPSDDAKVRSQVHDFTYVKDRIFVSTTLGLFAIGQDTDAATAPEGFLLEWKDPDAKSGSGTAATPSPASSPAPRPTAPRPTARTPYVLAEEWAKDAMQIRDAALRHRKIDALRAALEGTDSVAVHAALLTLARIGKVAYDKAAMRPLVLARLKASEGEVRVAAAYALWNTAAEPDDLALVLPIAEDGSLEARTKASHLLALFTRGKIEGPAATAVERLLDSRDERLVRETLRGLWGAKVAPGVEERLLVLAKAPATRHDAIYFGLSTLAEKSERVIDALIDALGDPDSVNIAGRALWGLGQGVPPEGHSRAADGLVLLLQARDDARVEADAIRMLSKYGGETHATFLDGIGANSLADAATRAAATDAAAAIRTRAARGR
jgi:outer membrane protein assembly factor BamB